MKNYTVENDPVFSESIRVTETSDPAHAENINAAPKQLLENTLANKAAIEEIKQGEQEVAFEDYTGEEAAIPEPEEAINQLTSGKKDKLFRQYVKAALKNLLSLAQRALSIALGKNQARVFATVAALDAWLAVPANVAKLNVGDNFYITATDVPDYWWDGTQKQKLETQKVDLTTYDQEIAALKQKDSELSGNISSHTHDGRYYTESEINTKLAGKSDTSRGHAWSAITGKPNTFAPSSHNHVWSDITGKPTTFAPSSHSHDDKYYTETEINNILKSLFKICYYSTPTKTLSSAGQFYVVDGLDITQKGYKPIGFINIQCTDSYLETRYINRTSQNIDLLFMFFIYEKNVVNNVSASISILYCKEF